MVGVAHGKGVVTREEVYRLLRRSILRLLKSDHQHHLFPPKSSYPVHPSPKTVRISNALLADNTGYSPLNVQRLNLILTMCCVTSANLIR